MADTALQRQRIIDQRRKRPHHGHAQHRFIVTPFVFVPNSASAKGAPLRPGAGTVAIANALGNSIGAPPNNQTFDFAFRPALSGGGLLIGHGYVSSINGGGPIAPMIAGTAVGGNPGPVLELDSSIVDANGQSYAVLEVHPDDKGQLTDKTPINIVHGDATPSTTPAVG